MPSIPPKIIKVPSPNRTVRDAVLGIQQHLCLVAKRGVSLVAFEFTEAFLVAGVHPLKRTATLNLFEPKIRIVKNRRPLRFFAYRCNACHGQSA